MAHLVGFVEELIQEVGPRPATSESEQRAAELIARRFESYGLETSVEEFTSSRGAGWTRVLYYVLVVAAAGLLFFMPQLSIAALVLALVGAALLVLELLDKNPLSGLLNRGLSQNVVARYTPSDPSDRRRRIIVVAHYDSGRSMVQASPLIANFYVLIRHIIRGAVVAVFLITALHFLPFGDFFKNLLGALGLLVGIIVLLALIAEIVNLFMPFNQGANANGSGVAALMGVAEFLTGKKASDSDGFAARSRKRRDRDEKQERSERLRRGARETEEALSVRRSGSGKVLARGTGVEVTQTPESTVEPEAPSVSARKRIVPGERESLPPGVRPRLRDGSALAGAAIAAASREADSLERLSRHVERAAYSEMSAQEDAPGVRRRPPLPTQEEQDEKARSAEERVRAEQSTKEQQVPAWFASAKKKAAEKEAALGKATGSSAKAVRSQFADIPITAGAVQAEQAIAQIRSAAAITRDSEIATQEEAVTPNEASTNSQAVITETGSAKELREVAFDPSATIAASAIDLDGESAGEASTPTAESKVPSRTYMAPNSADRDMSGIDTSAFEVLNDNGSSGAVVVPARAKPATTSVREEEAVEQERVQEEAQQAEAQQAPLGIRLPEILATPAVQVSEENRRKLNIPSILPGDSGVLPVQQAAFNDEFVSREELSQAQSSPISITGSFAALGATGTMKPVGQELLEYHATDNIYVEDADDSHETDSQHREASYAPHPQRVEIPDSRARSFFGGIGDRFSGKRKRDDFDDSASSWIGVDVDFDARTEGGNIGSWDRFSEDDDGWKGGAFGGASFEENEKAISSFSFELLDKEVWLVALGAHEAKNAGIRELLRTHSGELRNALIINIDSVGAGDLCYTVSEGVFRKNNTDRRLQDIVQSCATESGIEISPVSFAGYTTDAAEAMARGARAISIIGLDKDLPVGWRWSDNHSDVLSEEAIQETASLVTEILKSS